MLVGRDEKPGTMHNNVAGEGTKKRLVFGRLLSLSVTYFEGSAIAAMGGRREYTARSLHLLLDLAVC